jgi:outer membrane protein assembly factor BamE (lipoprotein component of BamABCDE complex)
MKLMTSLVASALAATVAGAQTTSAPVTIDPGMTRAQVVEKLGKPAAQSSRGEFTYLFYSNGSERRVGMSDIVTLQGDKVIDAIFRSPRRAYSGTSSSPRAIPPQEAAKGKPTPVIIPPTP